MPARRGKPRTRRRRWAAPAGGDGRVAGREQKRGRGSRLHGARARDWAVNRSGWTELGYGRIRGGDYIYIAVKRVGLPLCRPQARRGRCRYQLTPHMLGLPKDLTTALPVPKYLNFAFYLFSTFIRYNLKYKAGQSLPPPSICGLCHVYVFQWSIVLYFFLVFRWLISCFAIRGFHLHPP